MNDLKEMYLAELQELHSVEGQLVEALRKMADAAQHDALKQAFTQHLEQTRTQQQRLEEIIRKHGQDPREHKDQAMESMIQEAEKMKSLVGDRALADAALIASAQKVEHYEIAAYGTVATYAGILKLEDDQRALHQTLEEEKQTDAKLTELAKNVVNPDAASAS